LDGSRRPGKGVTAAVALSGYTREVGPVQNDPCQARLTVAVEEGGRISIPLELYDRIGSGPGGVVMLRRAGDALVIERVTIE
jgi:hypothetical protein